MDSVLLGLAIVLLFAGMLFATEIQHAAGGRKRRQSRGDRFSEDDWR